MKELGDIKWMSEVMPIKPSQSRDERVPNLGAAVFAAFIVWSGVQWRGESEGERG